MQLVSCRSCTPPHIAERGATAEREEVDRALALSLETLPLALTIIGLALLFASRQERQKHSNSVYLIHGMSGKPLHVSGDCISYNRSS